MPHPGDPVSRDRLSTMDHDAAALKDLQERLHEHFRSLASARERSDFPIFALEHGLSPEELKRIYPLLRARLKARLPLAPHWLLWVVYASEAGYGYAGDEYWPSFEKQTPTWQFQDRPKIKNWFTRFQNTYSGVVPSGPWAKQFSIIAWPITHALLPRYLQRQFARLLYDLRFRLASGSSSDTGSIGRLLAAHAFHASTRLQQFLQQEELTGQIVVALLRGESAGAQELIHTPTLRRVVADLEQVRNSREWLKETRRVVSDRFTGIGRGTGRFPPTTRTRSEDSVLPDASRFAIRPDLLLRHVRAGNWSVVLWLKSFRPVAAESAELRTFLDKTRCRLNGASDWKPTGWLLSGDRKGALKIWPDTGTPLIQFERPNPLMDHLLESEYRLAGGPVWLFRIGNDGIAHYIVSRTVRPAHDYVVVTEEHIPQELPGFSSCTLDCAGVRAFRLAVPAQVSAEATARLKELGLAVARTIQVWPAGLPGRGWDGEGSSEWLTTESPCFGIAPDHPLDTLSFRLNGEPEQILPTNPQGGVTFVRMPPLPAGIHKLTVEAHRSPELDQTVSTPPAKGFVRLTVREPEPWTPGIASHAGLIVTTDPYDANLDVFWRNELDLSVVGPGDVAVSVQVSLHAADGRRILSEHVGRPIDLPITPDGWRRVFANFLNDESRAWRYLEAASCTLEINGESLGTCSLRFDHDPVPIRWVCSSRRRETFVRLVDDSGRHDTVPEIQFYSMTCPLDAVTLDAETARADQTVAVPGGLFLARLSPFSDAAVVSAPPPRVGLQDLGVEPDVGVPEAPPALRNAFALLRLWHGARQAGFLANVRQRQVVRSIVNAIFRGMCGKNWAEAEETYFAHPTSQAALQELEARVDRRTEFGRILRRHSDTGDSEAAIAARFAAEAARQNVSQDRDLCLFAFRLASRPLDVLSDSRLDDRITELTRIPALLRGARLVSLLREHHGDRPAAGPPENTQP